MYFRRSLLERLPVLACLCVLASCSAGEDTGKTGDKAKDKAGVGLMVFKEAGYAGPPVKKLEAWFDAKLQAQFGSLCQEKPIQEVIKKELEGLPLLIVTTPGATIRKTMEDNPRYAGLLVVYLNSASLRYRVNGPSDDLYVRRANGEYEMISRMEHKEPGSAAPNWAKSDFYQNYCGAEGCLFLRGSTVPAVHCLAVDGNSTPKPTDADFDKLLKTLLKDLAPKTKAAMGHKP